MLFEIHCDYLENNYKEEKCQVEIEKLKKCCEKYEHLNQVCCSGFSNSNKT